MSLQNETRIINPLGKQGTESRQDPVAQGSPYFAKSDEKDNKLVAGGFAFEDGNCVLPTSSNNKEVPTGVVIYNGNQIGLDNGCEINDNEVVKVLYRGCVFSKPFENDASVNDKVMVNPSTGEIKAAENDPSDSYVDTGWIVKTAAKAGDVVEIQKL